MSSLPAPRPLVLDPEIADLALAYRRANGPLIALVNRLGGGMEKQLGLLPDRVRAEIERMVIEATLARHNGSVPKAARVLELSPSTLYRKIEGWTKA